MRDYVKEMLNVWSVEGEQAAYDLGAELMTEIKDEHDRLQTQSSAISALGIYLRDVADVAILDPNPVAQVELVNRSKLITEAALALWQRLLPGNSFIKVQSVLEELNRQGRDLGVQQPFAVIGTVLARADGFTKVARNTFEYRPPIDDLPF